jgi:hypothetical protein
MRRLAVSEFWNSPEEVVQAFLGMVDKAYQDPVIRSKGEGQKSLVVFRYHDPDAILPESRTSSCP